MLDLSRPVWQQLHGPFGSSEAVPGLLQQLQDEYTTEVKDALYWEHLFHQDTIYSITYAALPYLVELARLSLRRSAALDQKTDPWPACGRQLMRSKTGSLWSNCPISAAM